MSELEAGRQPWLRYPGGEAGHRSFFGGTRNKARVAFIGLFVVGGMIGMIMGGGLVVAGIALVGVGVTVLVTQRTHNGTVLERRRKRRRWAGRKRLGLDRFVVFTQAGWDQIMTAAQSASRRARQGAAVAARQMRANPDGSDGMGWLQHGSNLPGISWHAPAGEEPYLAAVFSVSGQLRGMESAGALTRAAEAWGRFLAHRAAPSALIRRVQTLTRVLPPDTAQQQRWVFDHLARLDDDATEEQELSLMMQKRSYAQVIERSSENSMVQRHFVVLVWPLTGAFTDAAAKYGPGRDGWRALMAEQIQAAVTGLTEAKMGQVYPLTARQTTAVILHQQNPSMPIDLRSNRHVNPRQVGIGSREEFSAHVVDGGYDPTVLGKSDPISAAPAVEWWHRTAAIHGEDLSGSGRSPLWTLDLLIGREMGFIRSVSFHMDLVPQSQAKALARQDVVRDAATKIARDAKGVIGDDENDAQLSAAQRRRRDLAAGSHNHGVSWIGYITVTAGTREELAQACRRLVDVCGTGLGIERLDWQDSYQAAASGTTWPIGRGLKADTTTFADRALGVLAGRTEKEAIS